MKTTLVVTPAEPKFEPITLTITAETVVEALALRALFNYEIQVSAAVTPGTSINHPTAHREAYRAVYQEIGSQMNTHLDSLGLLK
jgi:hypothetical protein